MKADKASLVPTRMGWERMKVSSRRMNRDKECASTRVNGCDRVTGGVNGDGAVSETYSAKSMKIPL
jgi:hypothetical protein